MIQLKKQRRTYSLINIEDVGTNNIENIMGLKDVGSMVEFVFEGYKAFKEKNLRLAVKFLNDAYLIYKFAVQNTVRDVGSIKKLGPGALRRLYNVKHSISVRRTQGDVDISSPFFDLIRTTLAAEFILQRKTDLESIIVDSLDSLGLLPSPGNLWDLVPLSFVVDWFWNAGNAMKALRYERDEWHYTIQHRIESQKYRFRCRHAYVDTVFGSGWFDFDRIHGKLYRRSLYKTWGSFDPLSVSGGSGLGFTQKLEGASLILQRIL
jgi:hypothetical protein